MRTNQKSVGKSCRLLFKLLLFWILTADVFAFNIGDRVQANGTINVRQTPAGTLLGTQSSGSLGTVTGGPTTASLNGTPYTWYNINFNTGIDGWVADIGLLAAYSDLVTQSLAVSPASGNAGLTVNVSFTIRNQGQGPASPSTCNIRIATSPSMVTTSDPLLFQVNVPSLAAGATYNVNQNTTIPAGRAAGQNYIWAIEDVSNVAGQGPNTDNDYAYTGFTVTTPYSDLLTENLVANPTSGNAGSTVNVSFAIHNIGSGAATPSTCNIRIATSASTVTTSDPLLFQVSVPSIAAGATYNVNQNATIPAGRAAGQNYIWAIEDVGNVAGQGPNTENDYAYTGFTVTTPYSDLLTENLVINPTSGDAGSSVNVSFAIHNIGTGAASPSTCNIRIATSSSTVTTSDPLLFQVNVPGIAAGGSYNVNQNTAIPAGHAAGQNYVWVIEDIANVAGQGPNIGNDYAHTSFVITTPTYSDLVTENFVVNPTSGNAGSTINVSFTIHNIGAAPAAPSTCNIRIANSSSTITTSDPLLFQVNAPGIAASATYNVNQSATIPIGRATGQNYIWVIEDVGNVAGQGPNTGNDYAHAGFSVTGNGGVQPLGVDVSKYNGTVDWNLVRNAGGKTFAFVRATAGKNTKDEFFDQNIVDSRNAGLLVGAYHFAYPEYFTAHEEAQKFLSVAGAYIGAGYLPPVLDIEDSASEDSFPYRIGAAALSQWIRDWCSEVEAATGVSGRKVILYTFRWYPRNNYFQSDLDQHPFWVATYPADPDTDPGNIAPWSTWTFQQYRTDPATQQSPADQGGTCPGITGGTGYADLDSFNGSMSALNALAGNRDGSASSPVISSPKLTGTTFTLNVPSQNGFSYVLEFQNTLNDAAWIPVQTNSGSGGMIGLTNNGATSPSRIYRVRVQ